MCVCVCVCVCVCGRVRVCVCLCVSACEKESTVSSHLMEKLEHCIITCITHQPKRDFRCKTDLSNCLLRGSSRTEKGAGLSTVLVASTVLPG